MISKGRMGLPKYSTQAFKGKAEGCMGLPSPLLIFTLMIDRFEILVHQASIQ